MDGKKERKKESLLSLAFLPSQETGEGYALSGGIYVLRAQSVSEIPLIKKKKEKKNFFFVLLSPFDV